jgi:hypothetical protein
MQCTLDITNIKYTDSGQGGQAKRGLLHIAYCLGKPGSSGPQSTDEKRTFRLVGAIWGFLEEDEELCPKERQTDGFAAYRKFLERYRKFLFGYARLGGRRGREEV